MNSEMFIVEENNLRQKINQLISSGEFSTANTMLISLWEKNPGPAVANYVISCFEKLRQALNLIPFRIVILRSFTVEPLVPLLRAEAYINGIDLTVHVGGFNTYPQEILDKKSTIYEFKPDIVILAIQTRDVTPELWSNFLNLSQKEITEEVERVLKSISDWLQVFRSQCQAYFVLYSFELPFMPINGILDLQSEKGQVAVIQKINRELLLLAQSQKGVYLLDYDGLISRHGRENWHDACKWVTMRMPIVSNYLIHMVKEWMRFIHPLTGKGCKVLVIDLDNTLWGGVIGEDGMNGIKIGNDYPGAFYRELQKTILDLSKRGVILAISSKNNMADAMEVLEKHPEMLLRPEHFAIIKINWKDKVQNLLEIAKELNIGLDAIAFLDDNIVECQLIRSQLPEVKVIELPKNPAKYTDTLRNCPYFERLFLSKEDQDRGRHYTEQRLRMELNKNADSLEDFFWSLSMKAEIFLVDKETLPRAAQLTQKTNQFNMTTVRYSEQQIAEIANKPDKRVYLLRLLDRFGDSGIVGESITHYVGETCEIEIFLLSCRILNRSVETTLLATIAEESYKQGIQRLVGLFIPSKRNSPASNFYESHGFKLTQNINGKLLWEFDLTNGKILPPRWIKRQIILDKP